MGAAMASRRPALSMIHDPPCIVDPTKLSCNSDDGGKYSASEERTFSRTCKSRVLCRYPGPRESVHIKLLVSPVSFSHNNVRLLMVYSPYGKFAYRATCRFRD